MRSTRVVFGGAVVAAVAAGVIAIASWSRSSPEARVVAGVADRAGAGASAERAASEPVARNDAGSEHQASADFTGLDSPDDHERFAAALRLVASDDPRFDERLRKAIDAEGFHDSPESRATVDFVRWKRSGKPFPLSRRPHGDHPDILLISIDTLRSDHLGTYGHGRATSPHIDALAERGVVFEHAFSPVSWTMPGHMSLFTSRYPSFHGLDARDAHALDPSLPTLAEQLHGLGYHTAGIVDHAYLDARFGFDHGFDLYWRNSRVLPAAEQTDVALSWLQWHLFTVGDAAQRKPIFLFVHYYDPHETYDAPPPGRGRFTSGYGGPLKPSDHLVTMFTEADFERPEDLAYTRGLYDEEVWYVDHELGRLFEGFEATGPIESSVVALTSDHGEELKDHGSMGHKTTVYREEAQVPLIMAYRPRIAAGQRLGAPVSLVDVAPTLVAMVGGTFPDDAQGLDLGPYIAVKGQPPAADPAPLSRRPLFMELGPIGRDWEGKGWWRAVRTAHYKLIRWQDEDGRVTKELYDVRADPHEQHDVYAARHRSAEVRALEARLGHFTQSGRVQEARAHDGKGPAPQMDEAMKAQLRALGYIK